MEALEGGRALLLSEVLELDRAELEGLVAADRADLKARYEQAAGRWNQLSRQVAPLADVAGGGPAVRGEALTEELRKARDELEATIAEIRKVAGYERFLLAPSFSDICRDAGADPLVYLGATELGGLALIVWPLQESVKTLWLPALTEAAVVERVRAYRDTYRSYQDSSRRPQDRLAWVEAIDVVTAWLWTAVMGKVLKALGNAPRATLVPAGLLGVLPLHAAWTPRRASVVGRRYALDGITLTYTPNARALAAARTLRGQVQGEHLVAVDAPAIGDGEELALPYSSVEVGAAAATFPDPEILPGEQATQRRVLAALARAQVFHLSCHGRADLAQPLHSALAMARAEPPVGVEPLTLEELMRERLYARLGVLSACETGIPGEELPDEVVSLPTGLLQAGTGGVVASLWSVPERATAMLMFRFYEGWRVEQLAPAAALRQAQRWVRDTTNGEKVAYFGTRRPGSDHPMASAARSLWKELFGADPAARDHRRPYHWAAFTHIGG